MRRQVDYWKDMLAKYEDALTPRESAIMFQFYYMGRKLADIGRDFDISGSRAGQIRWKAEFKLMQKAGTLPNRQGD